MRLQLHTFLVIRNYWQEGNGSFIIVSILYLTSQANCLMHTYGEEKTKVCTMP